MKNYINTYKVIGRFYIHIYQILGSMSDDPSLTDPIRYSVYDIKKPAWDNFSTIFHDAKYGFMGDITTLRKECKYPVGEQRFKFYERYHKRLNQLSKRLAILAFPEYKERLCK
jgi:hypothetical protein